ncbi:hypothetical protein NMY22_g5974 [Coprinellus aureogranulatus]|nr:hypothetical protein NMY22_g5974 [Coprinellus aureogranulatus]
MPRDCVPFISVSSVPGSAPTADWRFVPFGIGTFLSRQCYVAGPPRERCVSVKEANDIPDGPSPKLDSVQGHSPTIPGCRDIASSMRYKSEATSCQESIIQSLHLPIYTTMLFKLSSVVLAAAALVSASPSLSKRGLASCTASVSGFNFPESDPLPSGSDVTAEWAVFISQLFSESTTPVSVPATTVTGPAGNIYTVTFKVGGPNVDDARSASIAEGWVGRTIFSVPPSAANMRWHIDAVTCA